MKFGYVVYTDSAVASRLLAQGYVMVGYAKVAVKEMDGQPAQFVNWSAQTAVTFWSDASNMKKQ